MITRVIPSSGEQLPVIGIGTWIQFDVDDNETQKQPLRKVLQLMAQNNATLIDSSPMYGRAETMIGSITQELEKPDQFFYATKVWTSGEKEGISQMNNSIQKMKRTVIDLMQVHNLLDYKIHLKTLKNWKAEGKVRYIGITHYLASAHAELEKIMMQEKVDFVQFNYSIRERNAEKRLLDAAKDAGVAVIINEPFDKGYLFRATINTKLPEWTTEYDIYSWTDFFLKYIVSHPSVTCVIPGTSEPTHVLENIKAGQGKLPDEAGRKKMVQLIESL
jgi:diketogulonate reductase-like aldo/keto reductase